MLYSQQWFRLDPCCINTGKFAKNFENRRITCISDTYQHTDSEKYSTLSVSKKISNQSSAFFSNQSTTIYERTPSLSYCNGTFYCYVIILFPTNCIKCFYNIERILYFFCPDMHVNKMHMYVHVAHF